jgi:MarR family transcriptional regulator, lower aerobic nicotinate degradation pathway regulator
MTSRAAPTTAPKRPPRPARDIAAVLGAIASIDGALRLASRAVERRLGISGAQLFALQKLAEAPVQSLNELAARTFTHQSSVSTLVTRLVARGLVSRTTAPEDARRVVIALTPAGRSLLQRAPEPLQVRLVAGLKRLSPRERRSLARGLDKLAREAGISGAPPTMFLDDEPLRPRLARRDRRRRH